MTEEEVKKLIKENIKEFMADYYRETHPGYEIASGSKTLGHGESEYCMSTDTLQGIHFYKMESARWYLISQWNFAQVRVLKKQNVHL